MKICLIGPPTLPEFGVLATVKELRETLADAPLGILSLAAVLDGTGIKSEVLSPNQSYYDYLDSPLRRSEGVDFCQFMVQQIASSEADVFGFGSICSSYPLTVRMAAELRKLRPLSTIIFGGPQASAVDQETLDAFPWVDVIVRGEAEETLPLLLQTMGEERQISEVPGITMRVKRKGVRTAPASLIQDLDALPTPKYEYYLPPVPSSYVPLELGRGCPFSCTFCSTNDFFRRRFRLKSAKRVLEQMIVLNEKYGVTQFELVHDMFTVDRKKVVEFCKTLCAAEQKFTWSCSARTDCVDEALIDLMAKAGCSGIFFGIETGSPRMQKIIDKGLDLDQARQVVRHAHHRGIGTTVSLIAGFPEETRDDLSLTANFLLDALRYDDVETHLQLLAPLAKTPIQSQYRDLLFFEDTCGEFAKLGWEQDSREQELVRSHPEIFPNFYFLPTTLDRGYLQEFVAFYLTSRSQFRWLLLTLHEHSGDIVTVFEAWRAWHDETCHGQSREPVLRYYLSADFIREFFDFVSSRYLSNRSGDRDVRRMLAFEVKWRSVADRMVKASLQAKNSTPARLQIVITLESVPVLAPGVHLVPIDDEEAGTIHRLRASEGPRQDATHIHHREFLCVHSSDGIRIDVSRLSPLSSSLMALCDGQSNMETACNRFTSEVCLPWPMLEALAPEQICISGLVMLAERGLVTFLDSRK